MEEVGVIHEVGVTNKDDGEYNYAPVDFPDEWARYVRYKVTETRQDTPNIGEVMVFGVGYAYDGEYESDWLDFGTANNVKNFKSVTWDGTASEGTSIKIQTKTAYYNASNVLIQSDWSDEYSKKTFELESPEPATMVKYKVKLSTQDYQKSPSLESITFSYSEDDQPVDYASAFILPTEVAMGADSTFVYNLAYDLKTGQDLKSVSFSMPSFSRLNYVYSTALSDTLKVVDNNPDTVDSNEVVYNATVDSLYVTFPEKIMKSTDVDSLYFSFTAKLLKNIHNFHAFIYNEDMNDDAGGVKVWENKDLGTITVLTSSIKKGVITEAKAVPKVFTPNDDNTNDFTVIEFTLAKITTDVKIYIFGTNGGLVATIFDDVLDPKEYFIPDDQKLGKTSGELDDLPGFWDGRDEDGDKVPPGVYFYQIVADTDDGDKSESGTVVVAY